MARLGRSPIRNFKPYEVKSLVLAQLGADKIATLRGINSNIAYRQCTKEEAECHMPLGSFAALPKNTPLYVLTYPQGIGRIIMRTLVNWGITFEHKREKKPDIGD